MRNQQPNYPFYYSDGFLWFDNGKKKTLISDAFSVVGYAIDSSGERHYILQHANQTFSLPWQDVGERSGRKILRKYIRKYPTNKRTEQLLIDFIQDQPIDNCWTLADVAGWHGNAYILPDGTILGETQNTLFLHSAPHQISYNPRGSLQDWKQNIGRYLTGNSCLSLCVAAAFAAPLLRYFNIEGGILHFYGESSSGKTTAQKAALSVWGHGKDAGYSWNATGYALTNAAAARSDGLLSLDEIGEDDKRAVETCTYTIANGRAKLQGSKEGGNLPNLRFRVLAISSGETTLAAHLHKGGKKIMAGQMVRCPSIPYHLENAHHFHSLRSFAEHLNEASIQFYGTAGRAFIDGLINNPNSVQSARDHYEQFLNDCLQNFDLSPQNSRTARLFALCAASLILASEWNITGITPQEAKQRIYESFTNWITIQPKGNIEDNQIKEHAIDIFPTLLSDFVQIYEHGVKQEFPHGFIGVVSQTSDGKGNFYDVLPAKFKELFCIHGTDKNNIDRVIKVLGQKMCWLQKPEHGRSWQYRRRINGELIRVYRFLNASPPEQEDN